MNLLRRSPAVLMLLLASCAGPNLSPAGDVNREWTTLIEQWHTARMHEVRQLTDLEERDRRLEQIGELHNSLVPAQMYSYLRAVEPGHEAGLLTIEGEMVRGTEIVIRLLHGPAGAHVQLYRADDLGPPRKVGKDEGGFWVLDFGKQQLEAEGHLDRSGGWSMSVRIPDDAAGFRAWQALVAPDGSKPKRPTSPVGRRISR